MRAIYDGFPRTRLIYLAKGGETGERTRHKNASRIGKMKGVSLMKRHLKGINVAIAALALTVGVVITSCGTEEAGTNGASEDYFPTTVGARWVYDTFNLTRDPGTSHPFYTHVSVENAPAGPGGAVEPIFVTKYAKNDANEWLRLNQAAYWVNKDIFYKYDYFSYNPSNDPYFHLKGYYYTSEYHDPVIGTFFYDTNGQRRSFALFKFPLVLNDTWDVLDYTNADPLTNPTVFSNVDQKDYFGLARDMDRDGRVDTMDISVVAQVTGSALVDTDLGSLNCHVVELTQNLVFHMTTRGDVQDISTTTYWVAPYHGVAKVRWYEGSTQLDEIEMRLRTWWFVK
jgi:hypothetical protein